MPDSILMVLGKNSSINKIKTMKKIYLLFLLISISNLNAQDIIERKNGTTIEAKIDEVGVDIIKYHRYDNLSGPLYIFTKRDVDKITFENGHVEVFNVIEKSKLKEVKEKLARNINKYGFERDSDKKAYKASFEGDNMRLIILHKNGDESRKDDLFDFSTVYKFGKVDKRKKELAYINIWVAISTNEKKNKWDKYKLVMRVKGHKNADRIMKQFKDLNELLYLQN